MPNWAADIKSNVGATRAIKDVAQGSLSSLAAFPPRRAFDGAAQQNPDYLVCGAARARTAGIAAGPDRGPCATTQVPISFSWTPMSATPFAVGGRLAVPSVCIAGDPRWVGQTLPLLGDRVAQGGKLQAQRLQFERRLRLCDPEVATVNSSLELIVGSSSKEKPTVTKAVTVATRSHLGHNPARFHEGASPSAPTPSCSPPEPGGGTNSDNWAFPVTIVPTGSHNRTYPY
jgi:hypothetical protein